MFKRTLVPFAAGAVFALAVAGGATVATAQTHAKSTTSVNDNARIKTGAYDYYSDPVDVDENGYDDTLLAWATCPAGTQMTGGGGFDNTYSGWIIANEPIKNEGWMFAVGIDESVNEDPDDVTVSVVCLSPDGRRIGGSYRPAPTHSIPPEVMRVVKAAKRR